MSETVDVQAASYKHHQMSHSHQSFAETIFHQRKIAAKQDKQVIFLNFSLFSPSAFYTFYQVIMTKD